MKFAKAATAVIAGAALGVLTFAGVASAHDGSAKDYVAANQGAKSLQVGDDLCAAPWYWEGPGNAGNTGKSVDYDACSQNRHGASDDDQASVSVLNDACIAPWHWNGPLNVLNTNTAADYQAC